jgi:YtkA-like
MRVRLFFWLLLIITCISVIVFASTFKTNLPASVQVYLERSHPVAHTPTMLSIHIADPQGVPIDQAHAIVRTNMTNMDMGEQQQLFADTGQGNYEAHFLPSMAGPWVVTILVHADGFAPIRQQLFIQVALHYGWTMVNSVC